MSGSDWVPEPKKKDPAVVRAELSGFTIIRPESNQLLVDLDDGREMNQEVLARLKEMYGPLKTETWTSKSGRGKHVVLTFAGRILRSAPVFNDSFAIALEAALGSDPIRAIQDLWRVRADAADARVLFRPTANVEAKETFDDLSQEQHRQVFNATVKFSK